MTEPRTEAAANRRNSEAAAGLLSRSLSGYLCGTHSGLLNRRRGDRLTLPALSSAHAQLALDPDCESLPLGVEIWRPAPGAETLAAGLRRELDVPAVVDLVIYGSQARGTVTRYSDVDAILVIDDEAARSPAALRQLRPRVLRAQRHVLTYQPMQHHGFEVVTPSLLRVASDALALPREALTETRTLLGHRLQAGTRRPTPDEACRRLQTFVAYLLTLKSWPRHPWSLHGAISMFELAPALFAQAIGERVPKWRSFEIGQQRFEDDWAPYDTLRELREGWPDIRPGLLTPMLRAGANPWPAVDAWRRLPIGAPERARGRLTPQTLRRLQTLVARMQSEAERP